MTTRSRALVRSIPVVLALTLAIVEVLTYGGLFFPDTVQFLRHTWLAKFAWRPYFNVIPPGYPLTLDVILAVVPPAHRMLALVLLQQASVVASVWLILRIGELFQRPRLGWVAALLTAGYVPLGLFAQSAQTESLFVLWSLLALYFAAAGHDSGAGRAWLAAGAAAGFALAQRTVGIAVPLSILLALAVGGNGEHDRTRVSEKSSGMRAASMFLGALAATICVFVGLNAVHFGSARLVVGTGIHLFGRVAMIEKTGPPTAAVQRLHEAAAHAGMATPYVENAGWLLSRQLTGKEGFNEWEADALLRTAALQTFLSNPIRTARLSAEAMNHMVRPVDVPWEHFWGGLHPETYQGFLATAVSSWKLFEPEYRRMERLLPGYPPPARLGPRVFDALDRWSAVAQTFTKGTWTLVAMIACVGLGLARRDFALVVLSTMPLGFLGAAALGDGPMARYWEVAIPVFLLMCVLGLDRLQTTLMRIMRRLPLRDTRAGYINSAPVPRWRRDRRLPAPGPRSPSADAKNGSETTAM